MEQPLGNSLFKILIRLSSRKEFIILFILKIILLLIFLVNWCFAYEQLADWNYVGKNGPVYWSRLNSSYNLCNSSKHQSPIDISSTTTRQLYHFNLHYSSIPQDFIKNNYNLYEVNHNKNQYILFNNEKFDLLQFHFHTPSEHALQHQRYPLEMHLVHANAAGQYLIIGVLLKPGKTNAFLKHFFASKLPDAGHEVLMLSHKLNPSQLIPKNSQYYVYNGSLTTPPCSEDVIWILYKNPIEASPSQIRHFKTYITEFNARPLQKVNGRTIYL